jgi:transposase InsO family protein
MKLKSQVFACFKLFRAFFEKDRRHKIMSLRSDNGGEYISNEFSAYLGQAGISHKPGPPHLPELNGVAKRANRTIGNLVRCSLLSASLPKSFWADAIRHILHSLNSVPCHTPLGFKAPNSMPSSRCVIPSSFWLFGLVCSPLQNPKVPQQKRSLRYAPVLSN